MGWGQAHDKPVYEARAIHLARMVRAYLSKPTTLQREAMERALEAFNEASSAR